MATINNRALTKAIWVHKAFLLNFVSPDPSARILRTLDFVCCCCCLRRCTAWHTMSYVFQPIMHTPIILQKPCPRPGQCSLSPGFGQRVSGLKMQKGWVATDANGKYWGSSVQLGFRHVDCWGHRSMLQMHTCQSNTFSRLDRQC